MNKSNLSNMDDCNAVFLMAQAALWPLLLLRAFLNDSQVGSSKILTVPSISPLLLFGKAVKTFRKRGEGTDYPVNSQTTQRKEGEMNTKAFLFRCKQEEAEELLGDIEERDAGVRSTIRFKISNLRNYEN